MDFLLELGVEDLPSRAVERWLTEAANRFSEALSKERLSAAKIKVLATIRRLVLYAEELPEKQPARVTEIPGPPAAVAFNPDGSLSPAGAGYCRAHQIKPEELRIKNSGKKQTTYYLKEEAGRPTREVLSHLIPTLVGSFPFELLMRWGEGDASFVRPVNSLFCFAGTEPLPLSFAGVQTITEITGHPILTDQSIVVTSITDYFEKIRQNYVLLDAEERTRQLTEEIKRIIPEGACFKPEGVKQIALMLEYPRCALSNLPIANLPYPLESVALIIENLKCLPLFNKKGTLLAEMVIVTDGQLTAEIQEGMRWVMENRLKDAQFFWEEDIRLSLAERQESLKKVIFQSELGTLSDYTQRLEEAVESFAVEIGLPAPVRKEALEAAKVAKIDLTTSMVREFPALAGIIAANLLKRAGYPKEVATAVREHYLPRSGDDQIPKTGSGCLLSFSDKMVTLAGLFAAGITPSGSADPYGLRRLSSGAIEVAWQGKLKISLQKAVQIALAVWKQENADLTTKVQLFLRQRIANALEGIGYRPDVISAVLSADGDCLTDYPTRATCLSPALKTAEGQQIITTFIRVINILKQATENKLFSTPFQPEFLKEEAEKNLAGAWQSRQEAVDTSLKNGDYTRAWSLLAELCPYINLFFDQVLVMTPEEKLRANRLSLLKTMADSLNRIGQLTKLQF